MSNSRISNKILANKIRVINDVVNIHRYSKLNTTILNDRKYIIAESVCKLKGFDTYLKAFQEIDQYLGQRDEKAEVGVFDGVIANKEYA